MVQSSRRASTTSRWPIIRIGLARAGAAKARHQIALAVVRAEHLHVARGKAGVDQALRHGFGGRVVLPTESVVLISISCLKMSRASWW